MTAKNNGMPDLKVNYIYNLLYQVISIIIPFITIPYVSRVLGANNVGIYSFVNANANYFILIGVFGLTTYSQYEVAKKRYQMTELKKFCTESMLTRTFTIALSCILYVVMYIMHGSLEYQRFYSIQLIAVLAYVLDVSWIYQGLESFKTLTMRNLFVKGISAVFIFLMVNDVNDLWKYILINALAILAGNLIVLPNVFQYFNIHDIDVKQVKYHLKATSIYFLPSIASTLISTLDKLMLGWFTELKLENGYYEQACNIESIIFMLFASLNITMRPRMAYLFQNKEIETIQILMKKSLAFVLLFVLPVSAGLYLIADLFVPWYFGAGFEKVAVLLRIMSMWVLIKAVSNCLVEQAIVPNNGQVTATKLIWVSATSNISLNFILIPRYFSIGATFASLATEFVFLVLVIYVLRGKVKYKELFPDLCKEILGVIVMSGMIIWIRKFAQSTPLWICMIIVIGAATYLGFEILLKNSVLVDNFNEIKRKTRKGE